MAIDSGLIPAGSTAARSDRTNRRGSRFEQPQALDRTRRTRSRSPWPGGADQASRCRRKNTAGMRKLTIGIDSDRAQLDEATRVRRAHRRSRRGSSRSPTTSAPSVNRIVATGRPVTVSGRCGGRGSSHGVPSMVVPVGSSGDLVARRVGHRSCPPAAMIAAAVSGVQRGAAPPARCARGGRARRAGCGVDRPGEHPRAARPVEVAGQDRGPRRRRRTPGGRVAGRGWPRRSAGRRRGRSARRRRARGSRRAAAGRRPGPTRTGIPSRSASASAPAGVVGVDVGQRDRPIVPPRSAAMRDRPVERGTGRVAGVDEDERRDGRRGTR